MGRRQDRKAAKRETSAVEELCKVQRKYVPELFDLFEGTADPRNQSYITYTNRMMPGLMYFKVIAGIIIWMRWRQSYIWERVWYAAWGVSS